jgi:hypothetical protein
MTKMMILLTGAGLLLIGISILIHRLFYRVPDNLLYLTN